MPASQANRLEVVREAIQSSEISDIPKSARALLALFGTPEPLKNVPMITQMLVHQNLIYVSPRYSGTRIIPSEDLQMWQTDVDSWGYHNYDASVHTPHSPYILPQHVGNAPSILTITIGHHNSMVSTPKHDMVIGIQPDGQFSAFMYDRFQSPKKTVFTPIKTLDETPEARKLIFNEVVSQIEQPVISLWNLEVLNFNQPYKLVVSINSLQLSTAQLIATIAKNPELH